MFSCIVIFFFFKQKTAYEMRISDWSSDVCSSDLLTFLSQQIEQREQYQPQHIDHVPVGRAGFDEADVRALRDMQITHDEAEDRQTQQHMAEMHSRHHVVVHEEQIGARCQAGTDFGDRSEEHTSELQSLMRISYAVFCLKKK